MSTPFWSASVANVCPYGIITANRKSPVFSRGFKVSSLILDPFPTQKSSRENCRTVICFVGGFERAVQANMPVACFVNSNCCSDNVPYLAFHNVEAQELRDRLCDGTLHRRVALRRSGHGADAGGIDRLCAAFLQPRSAVADVIQRGIGHLACLPKPAPWKRRGETSTFTPPVLRHFSIEHFGIICYNDITNTGNHWTKSASREPPWKMSIDPCG